jgi:hypothetical protein
MPENWEDFIRDLTELSKELRQALSETMEEEKKDIEKDLVLDFLKKLGIKYELTEYNRRIVVNAVQKKECKGYPIEGGAYEQDGKEIEIIKFNGIGILKIKLNNGERYETPIVSAYSITCKDKYFYISYAWYNPDLEMLRRKKDFVNFLNKHNVRFEERANVILFKGELVAVSPSHLILKLNDNERVELIHPKNTDYYNFVYVKGETEYIYSELKGVEPKYLNGYFVLVFENK